MTLANCCTGYGREIALRMLFFNEDPPWEDPALYDWPITEFRAILHKTADPGEAGTAGTNVADYTSYADVTINRNTAAWTLSGGGTFTPSISNTNSISWPQNTGTDQNIYAVTLALRSAAPANIEVARDAFAAVTVDGDAASGDTPRVGAGGLTFTVK